MVDGELTPAYYETSFTKGRSHDDTELARLRRENDGLRAECTALADNRDVWARMVDRLVPETAHQEATELELRAELTAMADDLERVRGYHIDTMELLEASRSAYDLLVESGCAVTTSTPWSCLKRRGQHTTCLWESLRNCARMPKKRRAVSDSRLMALWRRAVLAYWRYTDPISGKYDPTGEVLQCHHIVPRRHFLLRWDYRNGVPLTVESHQLAHTGKGRALLREVADTEYLDELEGWTKKDFLALIGATEDEFRLNKKAELEEVISKYEY